MDKSVLELLLAQGLSVERIGSRFGKDPSTIVYWLQKHGLDSPNRAKYAAKGGIEQERLEALVQQGMTIAEIADEVGLSKGTVRYWLRRFGLRTENSRGRRATELARTGKEAGPAHDSDDVPHSRRDRLRTRGTGLLPLQALPGRVPRSSRIPPPGSAAEAL